MKTITENSVISLMHRNYGNGTDAERCEMLQWHVSELTQGISDGYSDDFIRSEISDAYSVIIDIADRYGLHLDDVARMTVKKHKERGKG